MLRLVLTLCWTGVGTWLLAVGMTAWVLLRPARLTPARAMARLGRMSPADLGLAFEDVEFGVRDAKSGRDLRLIGWWLPGRPSSDRTVVIVHGYADSRIGALAWAEPIVRQVGCNVLVFDLRGHGESEGAFTTAGLRERFDVEQVVNQLRAMRPGETSQLFLLGTSMGAAIALAAAAQTGEGLAGVIADSPVADFYHGAVAQLSLMGLAGAVVARPGVWLTELVLGERFTSIRPAEVIRHRVRCPVLAMLPGDDVFLLSPAADELARAVADRAATDGGISQVVYFPSVPHLMPLQQDPAKYVQALNRFCAAGKSDRLARAPAAHR